MEVRDLSSTPKDHPVGEHNDEEANSEIVPAGHVPSGLNGHKSGAKMMQCGG